MTTTLERPPVTQRQTPERSACPDCFVCDFSTADDCTRCPHDERRECQRCGHCKGFHLDR